MNQVKLLLVAATMVCASANAAFIDGNKLLTEMRSESAIGRSLALGYVLGVADTMDGMFFCLPANATSGQVRDVVQTWLTSNPSQRHNSGDLLIAAALKTVWPCADKPKNNGKGDV